jgi:hypothetical protein
MLFKRSHISFFSSQKQNGNQMSGMAEKGGYRQNKMDRINLHMVRAELIY